MLAECQKVAELIGDLDCRTAVNLAWIEYHYLAGRTDAARAAHAAALATVQKRSAERPVGGLLALWAFRLEDAAADAAAALPRPIALELTGDPDAAASAWLDAGHVFFAALARISPHGEGLQRRLQRSADEFAAMHATAALGLVRRTADSLGITLPNGGRKRGPYRAARSHPFGLTRREVEILRMIVDGDGNRDIADRLNRSLRTIEHHVSAILGKLGLESRVQAALFAISHRDVLEH
jgi:DNA-binding CsgD family transcriptional regulator